MRDILTLLRTDGGQLTIATLLQEREAAAIEIERLRGQLDVRSARQSLLSTPKQADKQPSSQSHPVTQVTIPAGVLLRASDVRRIAGIAHSTLYRWVADGRFPRPVRVSERAVRWRSEDVVAWREGLSADPRCSNRRSTNVDAFLTRRPRQVRIQQCPN
jgi:prophage regulatory protein